MLKATTLQINIANHGIMINMNSIARTGGSPTAVVLRIVNIVIDIYISTDRVKYVELVSFQQSWINHCCSEQEITYIQKQILHHY